VAAESTCLVCKKKFKNAVALVLHQALTGHEW
jgi:hypothetical protein